MEKFRKDMTDEEKKAEVERLYHLPFDQLTQEERSFNYNLSKGDSPYFDFQRHLDCAIELLEMSREDDLWCLLWHDEYDRGLEILKQARDSLGLPHPYR